MADRDDAKVKIKRLLVLLVVPGVLLVVGLVLLPRVTFSLLFGVASYPMLKAPPAPQIPFDSATWQGGIGPWRNQMLDDMEARILVRGLRQADVEKLLGTPDSSVRFTPGDGGVYGLKGRQTYTLARTPELELDEVELHLFFDQHDRLHSVERDYDYMK